jgi:hypothetical protein
VIEYREKIQKIFSDVAPEHKFWLISGGELKNLEELCAALEGMTEQVFSHHANNEKNDFGEWVRNAIKDNELAETLFKIKTKESTLKAVKLRINSLKNLQQIHEAIDKMKNSISDKENELNKEELAKNGPDIDEIREEDFNIEEHKKTPVIQNSIKTENLPIQLKTGNSKLKEFLTSVPLYVGLLVGFGVGIVLGFYL